jgi:hypothetical protein
MRLAALISAIAGLLGALVAIVAFLGSLNETWELIRRPFLWISAARTRRLLERGLNNPDFDDAAIDRATRYYILPSCTVMDEAGEADWGTTGRAQREPLFDVMDQFLSDESPHHHLLLLAESGLGKTSFLLNYFARNLSRVWKRHRIALVYLGRRDALEQLGRVSDPRRTVLLLDSLDEDPEARFDCRKRIAEIMEAAQRFRRVVVTCRTQFFTSEEEIPRDSGVIDVGPRPAGQAARFDFRRVFLAPFDLEDVQRYLRRRYTFWERKKRQRALAVAGRMEDLAIRPMLLAHLPELVDAGREFQTASDLFDEMVNAWIAREAPCVKPDALREFSERMAVDVHVNLQTRGSDRVPGAELEPIARKWHVDLDRWALTSRSLLNRDSLGKYKFAHRSISEYLFVKRALRGDLACNGQPLTHQMSQFVADSISPDGSFGRDLQSRLAQAKCDIFTGSDPDAVLGWLFSGNRPVDLENEQAVRGLLATEWICSADSSGLLAHVHFFTPAVSEAREGAPAKDGVLANDAVVYWGLRLDDAENCVLFIGDCASPDPRRVGILVARREIRMEPPPAREHDWFQSQLGAFHDSELSGDDMIKVERHVRDCSDCQGVLKELAYLREVLREGAPSRTAPAAIWDKKQIKRIVKMAFAERETVAKGAGYSRWAPGTAGFVLTWLASRIVRTAIPPTGVLDGVPEEVAEDDTAGVEPSDADSPWTPQAEDMPLTPLDAEPPGRSLKDQRIENRTPKKHWRAIRVASENIRFPTPTRVKYTDGAPSGEPPDE